MEKFLSATNRRGMNNMDNFLEVFKPVFPLIVVSGLVLFVILRMKHVYKKGTIGKKKSTEAQIILSSLIPLGMVVGLVLAVLLSLFSSISLLTAVTWGPGIGFFFGYLVYEIYSKETKSDVI